jgi:hypothetical protein
MPPIEKQQFQHRRLHRRRRHRRGEDRGIAVEPDGYVWLSEEEQRLTANAPGAPRTTRSWSRSWRWWTTSPASAASSR